MTESQAVHPSLVHPFNDRSRRTRLVKVAAWLAGIAVLVRRAPGAGSRRQRLDLRPLGLDHGHPARVHRRRSRAADCADDADRPGLVLHPEGRLSERPAPLPAGARRLRGRRGDERLPAGEHRHARDAADVHGHDPSATFPGVLGGMVVQKIFFTVAGTASTCTCSCRCRDRSTSSSEARTTTRSRPP